MFMLSSSSRQRRVTNGVPDPSPVLSPAAASDLGHRQSPRKQADSYRYTPVTIAAMPCDGCDGSLGGPNGLESLVFEGGCYVGFKNGDEAVV